MTTADADTNRGRRRFTTTDAIRPGRTGRQTGTVGVLNLAAVLTLGVLVGFSLTAWFAPLVVFFAIGAGAGYSLSGSV